MYEEEFGLTLTNLRKGPFSDVISGLALFFAVGLLAKSLSLGEIGMKSPSRLTYNGARRCQTIYVSLAPLAKYDTGKMCPMVQISDNNGLSVIWREMYFLILPKLVAFTIKS